MGCKPMKKGLLAVFTGNGKGKTTAALGLAMRAAGQGLNICIIQFIKGNRNCGEHKAAELFGDRIKFHVTGKGFTWKSKDIKEDMDAAAKAWQFAKDVIRSGNFEMVILDELTYLARYEIVDEDEIVRFLSNKPEDLHVIVTGRYAGKALIDAADLVTEMREIKHPYQAGVEAQKGIEF